MKYKKISKGLMISSYIILALEVIFGIILICVSYGNRGALDFVNYFARAFGLPDSNPYHIMQVFSCTCFVLLIALAVLVIINKYITKRYLTGKGVTMINGKTPQQVAKEAKKAVRIANKQAKKNAKLAKQYEKERQYQEAVNIVNKRADDMTPKYSAPKTVYTSTDRANEVAKRINEILDKKRR